MNTLPESVVYLIGEFVDYPSVKILFEVCGITPFPMERFQSQAKDYVHQKHYSRNNRLWNSATTIGFEEIKDTYTKTSHPNYGYFGRPGDFCCEPGYGYAGLKILSDQSTLKRVDLFMRNERIASYYPSFHSTPPEYPFTLLSDTHALPGRGTSLSIRAIGTTEQIEYQYDYVRLEHTDATVGFLSHERVFVEKKRLLSCGLVKSIRITNTNVTPSLVFEDDIGVTLSFEKNESDVWFISFDDKPVDFSKATPPLINCDDTNAKVYVSYCEVLQLQIMGHGLDLSGSLAWNYRRCLEDYDKLL